MIIERIRTAGKCITGKSHVKKGMVCQDKIYCGHKNGVHAISLCDGAGSREKSHFGAEIVSKVVVDYLLDNFVDILMILENKDGVDIFKKKIIDLSIKELNDFVSNNDGMEIDDLSSTLLFVAVYENRYIAGHIGDGVIGLLKRELLSDKIQVLSNPENGSAPNITFFITDKLAESKLRIYSGDIGSIKGFILMSDGPEEALYSKGELSDNCKLLFDALNGSSDEDYSNFLDDVLSKKISDISYDDLSINILMRESIDTDDNHDEKIYSAILDNLADNQITKMSEYGVYVDSSIQPVGTKKKWDSRLNELKRRYDH